MEPSDGASRGRSLDRFEQSLKRLDPPQWIRTTTPLPPLTISRNNYSRPRYNDHRRSYSAQRCTVQQPNYWRGQSREPSPGPGSRPATAAGRFQSSGYSRWSASTLNSDGGISNGENTPTDSVISAFSMRSSLHGHATEPIYHPPQHLFKPSASQLNVKRPYLGWRSQDSLINQDKNSSLLTPAQRLASSYRHPPQPLKQPQRTTNSRMQHQMVHDSIKSISTAIMEFCQAEDVPPAPPPTQTTPINPRPPRGQKNAQIVWLESSFVSSTNSESKSKL